MSDVKRKQNIIHSKEQKIKDLFVIDTKCAKKIFFFKNWVLNSQVISIKQGDEGCGVEFKCVLMMW